MGSEKTLSRFGVSLHAHCGVIEIGDHFDASCLFVWFMVICEPIDIKFIFGEDGKYINQERDVINRILT